jgi:alkanesulfonate monooxygenase SsuD/methylene tetrahydromethanopterin reductase-like flavin-dependent oxidoreductase (luciferase family)
MRIGYCIDLNVGGYDPPMAHRDHVSRTMDLMIEEGITAERSGFHSLEIPHRHGRTEGYFPGPEQLLTLLARETERVAIGAFTYVATLYHPLKAAEQFSVIDNLSKGRLFTTLSRGYHPGYWQQFGVEQDRLLGRFKEAIAIWQEAFRGERFDFRGEHFGVVDGLLVPQPYQAGGWPIWGGGQSSVAAVQRSAEYGSCWTADVWPINPTVWEAKSAAYRQKAHELGKKPFIVLMRDGWVADSFEDAAGEFGDSYIDEMRFYCRYGLFDDNPEFRDEQDITIANARRHLVMGSPQECIERIESYKEDLGVDYIVMRFRMASGPSLEKTHDQIERFGAEVASYFHKKDDPPDHPSIPEACRW